MDFEEIYKKTYYSVMKFIVVRCNNVEDVNDILQDTYVELFKKLKRINLVTEKDYQNYILGIANNVIKRHFSRARKFKVSEIDEDDHNNEIIDETDIEEEFITKENVSQVWDYINSKDLITSKIFYLYYALDMKISEISKELNINESNVKNRIYRTLKEIKDKLGRDVIKSE